MQGKLKRAKSDDKRRQIEAELVMPVFPDPVRYLWSAYWRIRARRHDGPIELGDIGDFISLTGTRLAPWEVAIIEALDDAWLASRIIEPPAMGNP